MPRVAPARTDRLAFRRGRLPVRRLRLAVALAVVSALLPDATARAFCGFYVKEDDTRLTSRASRVVLMRDGTTTVLSMQSTYEGPTEDFALIVPVPSAIGEDDVRTLEPEVFDRLDQLTSPRLVEYWQEEPTCMDGVTRGYGGAVGYGRGGGGGLVQVEAAFAVGEYDVVVLSAEESSGLEAWLRAEGYHLPDGASEALRPYVEQGFRFFAARVNAERVRFEDGRALLSPLRIRTESERLMLPVRLGMLSSPGTQDLVVYVLSREGRFEVANRENHFVPTNLEVRASVRGRFGAFYEALLDRTWERHPGSVLTEYAWSATSCDPCPGPTMSADDVTTLGGDVATGAVRQASRGVGTWLGPFRWMVGPPVSLDDVRDRVAEKRAALVSCIESPTTFEAVLGVRDAAIVEARVDRVADVDTRRCLARALRDRLDEADRPGPAPLSRVRFRMRVNRRVRSVQTSARGFTVTRLRYRYGERSPATDLVFRRAPAVRGGVGTPDRRGRLPQGVRAAPSSTFQARYAILHRRPQRIRGCRDVLRGSWGGPPDGARPDPASARALDAMGSRRVRLERLIRTPVPELGIRRDRGRTSSRSRPDPEGRSSSSSRFARDDREGRSSSSFRFARDEGRARSAGRRRAHDRRPAWCVAPRADGMLAACVDGRGSRGAPSSSLPSPSRVCLPHAARG
ncbi:MAG TPA: DUF2330 domain-containing protein [Sandaracinaceae bacterium LLY-WYZ-13_1]|nr:DUF2330 domain-containing protein [Sandaracinaceae bacterium LLY-WYZ-13_1]